MTTQVITLHNQLVAILQEAKDDCDRIENTEGGKAVRKKASTAVLEAK